MIRANRLCFALALCAQSSACGLFFDTDALRQAGATGGGGTAGNGGGPGGGGAGVGLSGGAGGGGNGAFGGAGTGGNPGCDQTGYCGPGSSCGPDGFCSVVSTEAPDDVVGVAFIQGQGQGTDVGHVAVHSSSGSGSSERLSAWPLGFVQDQVALTGSTTLDDPGVGFITAGGTDYVYYFGQLQSCDVDANDDSCISVCSIDDLGIDCYLPRILTGASHLNGAVMVPGANPMQDSLYFLEASDASIERLQRVSRECLESNQQDCPAELAANYSAPDELDSLGLDYDPADGSIWWNTWGGAGFNSACVYRFDTTSSPAQPVDCVSTVPNITKPNRLAVSGAGVFVGTLTPEGMPGPIQRIGRCTTGGGNHPVTAFNKLTWPADADGRFLYATVLETPDALYVIDAFTGSVVTMLLDQNGNPITAVDASNPTYLLFAAGKRLYRWRKPPPPCAMQEGPQVCGNGCVEQGEACDDANDNADDGCNACQCAVALP